MLQFVGVDAIVFVKRLLKLLQRKTFFTTRKSCNDIPLQQQLICVVHGFEMEPQALPRAVALARVIDDAEPAPLYPQPRPDPSPEQRLVAVSVTGLDRLRADGVTVLVATHDMELVRRTGAPVHPMAPLPKLVWFAERARKQAYSKGTSNLASGFGFHYTPNRGKNTHLNQVDTSEYANIALGALAHLDQAGSVGMAPLPATVHSTLQRWMRRVVYGSWTASGYLNWDSGKGIDRIHLTQYWLLALRGFGTALMHGGATAIFAVAQCHVRGPSGGERRRPGLRWSIVYP